MHIGDLSSVTVDGDTDTAAERHRDIGDQFARGRCGPCSGRQVALGAIVASHLYNEARRSHLDDERVSTGSVARCHTQRRPSLYL